MRGGTATETQKAPVAGIEQCWRSRGSGSPARASNKRATPSLSLARNDNLWARRGDPQEISTVTASWLFPAVVRPVAGMGLSNRRAGKGSAWSPASGPTRIPLPCSMTSPVQVIPPETPDGRGETQVIQKFRDLLRIETANVLGPSLEQDLPNVPLALERVRQVDLAGAPHHVNGRVDLHRSSSIFIDPS
jgi:hypothetical protein